MRMRYTARRKRGLLAASKRMIAEGMTLRAAADELRVSHANLSKWAYQGMGEIDRVDKILRSRKKAALTGPFSQLKAIEDGLLRYIFEQREQGIEIKVFGVALRASFMSPEFREKSFTARCSCVKRFMHAHSFSYRMGTHTSQRPPAEVESEVRKRPVVSCGVSHHVARDKANAAAIDPARHPNCCDRRLLFPLNHQLNLLEAHHNVLL